MKALDLTGRKYARMTGVKRVDNAPGYKQARWLFRCDCGTEKVLFGYSVVHGTVQSCGCINREKPPHLQHGMTGTRTFQSWAAMRARCLNPRNRAWADYGGRGITIAPEWDKFEAFYRDMGPRPDGMTLDRFPDKDGNYEPGNCRWATDKQQVGNRRTTTYYEHEGITRSLQEWAECAGLSYKTVWARHRAGMRGANLLNPQTRPGGRPKTSAFLPVSA